MGFAQAFSDSPPTMIAQSNSDDAYDPFSDYSEFDEETDEEADINFFRHGRLFTMGFAGSNRSFTENMATIYGPATEFGLFISYFFDMRLALALWYLTGDHSVKFSTHKPDTYTGNVSISSFSFDLKYYLNTQNFTRGLADLNPYFFGGLGNYYRTYSISGLEGFSKDSTYGMAVGMGIEIPLMKKKSYLGIQTSYHMVTFADENKAYIGNGTEKLVKTISGDFFDTTLLIGINF